jgi:hypothetical protein
MPTPAPMTPQTLAIIRDKSRLYEAPAIAEEIGWDVPRLARVARVHGIELMNPNPLAPSMTPPATHPWDLPRPQPSTAPAPATPSRTDPSFDQATALMSPQQREIVRYLLARQDHNFISGTKITAAIGILECSLSSIIRTINRRFERMSFGWKIESKMGRDGGYRLVTGDGA